MDTPYPGCRSSPFFRRIYRKSPILPSVRASKTVVFTNGYFDILHVGHITLLGKAKALGDILIVGLNSNASIRHNKGDKRPIVSERERAHILAALDAVDFVVLFDHHMPLELLNAVKPDILLKGSDYTRVAVVATKLWNHTAEGSP